MSPEAGEDLAGRVVAVLRKAHDQLVREHLRLVREEAGPHYGDRPAEEIQCTATRAVDAYLDVLATGDWAPMEGFVGEIARRRFPQRFPPSEVQRAFATFREAADPLLAAAFSGEELRRAVHLVARAVDRAIHRFSDVYQALHVEELRATSAELEAAHAQLRDRYDQVAEAAAVKSRFFANMSHDLRSPLNSIIGYAELLRDGVDGPVAEEQRRDLRRILSSAGYLRRLIDDILDMTRIEAGGMEVVVQPFDVGALVEEAVETVIPAAYRKRIAVRAEVSRAVGRFASDREKVKQVLINLLDNGVKFTERGEVVCAVGLEGDRLRAEVRDTGVGIAEEDREAIFAPFRRGPPAPSGDRRGTGLGLALSRMLVELLGGRLVVESEPGRGSSFSFSIPTGAAPVVPGEGGSPRILVIEDDPATRELLEKVLASSGYDVATARDGTEGLRRAAERTPALVTLDLLMPDVDGREVLRRLREEAATRDVPVVVVSCLERGGSGLRADADAYLVKPIDRVEFLATVRRLVNRGAAPLQGDRPPA